VQQQGFKGFGENIKSLGEANILKEEICKLLGPKFDKNGWKFKLHIDEEL